MRSIPWLLGMAVLVLQLACTYEVELYCDDEVACEYEDHPTRTYCDHDGSIGGTGNECIEPPAGACVSDGDCTGADQPICDRAARVCRACNDSSECEARSPEAPVCGVGGACVAACEGFGDCGDAQAPICAADGLCVPCDASGTGDADCAARDDGAPYCLEPGACGECRDSSHCTDAEPVCDPEQNVCRRCEEHAECDSQVCDRDAGACIEQEQVVYVTTDGSGAACTRAAPCGSIQAGIDATSESRAFVAVAPGSYSESVTVSDKAFSMVAEGAELSPDASDVPVMQVSSGSQLEIEGLRLHGATGGAGDGLRCTAGGTPHISLHKVRLDQNSRRGIDTSSCVITALGTTIADNGGAGISADGGALTLERTTISENAGGGAELRRANFTLRNNFIVQNGTDATSFGGVSITDALSDGIETAIVDFNTIASNESSGAASGVFCLNVDIDLTLSNNIVYANSGGDPIGGNDCSATYSNIQGGADGDGNIDQDPLFADPDNGDFRLQAGSPCIDAADPDASIDLDFDGTSRPQGEGFDIGAHEFR